VIASAVVPTLIAGAIFLPRHLLEVNVDEEEDMDSAERGVRSAERKADEASADEGAGAQ